MIPKIVHTVWLGGPMPDRERAFFENKRVILQEYAHKLWNEENIGEIMPPGLQLQNFLAIAIENRKWAFASDLIKTLALVRIGGWALDADNEVVAPLAAFERMHWVSGFENYQGHISPITAVWGAVPRHRFSMWMLGIYAANPPELLFSRPNTEWISDCLVLAGAARENRRQYIEPWDVQLFPHEVFCGPNVKGATCALHHFNGSWTRHESE